MGYLADHPDELCVGDNDQQGNYVKRKPTASEIQQELDQENDLGIAKTKQREIIQKAYCVAECGNIDINVTGTNYTYPGGYSKAQMRDDALALLIRGKSRGWLTEETKTTFYDVNGAPIFLTEDEADQVTLRTAFKFEAEHTKMMSYLKAIDNAVTVEEVQAVVWS